MQTLRAIEADLAAIVATLTILPTPTDWKSETLSRSNFWGHHKETSRHTCSTMAQSKQGTRCMQKTIKESRKTHAWWQKRIVSPVSVIQQRVDKRTQGCSPGSKKSGATIRRASLRNRPRRRTLRWNMPFYYEHKHRKDPPLPPLLLLLKVRKVRRVGEVDASCVIISYLSCSDTYLFVIC